MQFYKLLFVLSLVIVKLENIWQNSFNVLVIIIEKQKYLQMDKIDTFFKLTSRELTLLFIYLIMRQT
jgi:hypothetical protein